MASFDRAGYLTAYRELVAERAKREMRAADETLSTVRRGRAEWRSTLVQDHIIVIVDALLANGVPLAEIQ